MTSIRTLYALGLALLLAACSTGPTRPAGWSAPEPLVAPSSFHGVHGLAVDAQGRLLAGTVVGNDMWVVDRNTGAARVFIAAPEGQADDIAIGPKGELAWTSYLQGIVRYRENDGAPIRVLAKDLPGINSLAFDMKSGKLYASQVFLGDAMWEIDVAGAQAATADRQGHGRLQRLRGRPRRHALRSAVVQGQRGEDGPGRRRHHRHQQRVQDPGRCQPGRQGQPVGHRHADRRAEPRRAGQRPQDGGEDSCRRRWTTWRSRPTARFTCPTWPTTRCSPSTRRPASCARSPPASWPCPRA